MLTPRENPSIKVRARSKTYLFIRYVSVRCKVRLRPDSTTAKFFARNRVCEMPKYDGWLHMSDSIEFALFFRFRSE